MIEEVEIAVVGVKEVDTVSFTPWSVTLVLSLVCSPAWSFSRADADIATAVFVFPALIVCGP